MTSRKRRLINPGLAWPLTSTELEHALGVDASNYGGDHVVWQFWERKPSATPLAATYYGPKSDELFSGPQITVSPVAKAELEPLHGALRATGLPELAEWIDRLATRPEPYLNAKPTVSWTWDGMRLHRRE